jgi:tetrapyrrole methylase family protein / MazG family protein
MRTLVIAGLGPGGVGQLTAEGRDLLQQALAEGRLLLRTRIHPTVEGWPALGEAPSLDHLYEQGADFGAVYERIAGAVLEAAQALLEGIELVYAVPGHPAVGEATVPRLRALARAAGIGLRLVPGLSFVDSVGAVLEEDLGEGLRVADALALGRIDPTVPLLVCQVYSRRVASGVKLALGKHYPDEHPVILIRAAGVPGQERISRRPLFEVDRDDFADHLTSLWVPPLAPLEALREPQTLQEVMARLRAPDGCPWDREQTHASLRKYLLEETYETLEALDAGDVAALEEELGDLLLQIVFHAQVADEAGEFDLGDVVAGIVAKLIRRHPHVFGDEAHGGGAVGHDAEAVLRNWETLKRAERAQKGAAGGGDGTEGAGESGGRSMLDGVPRAMPALAYAQAVQERVARVGFDWPDVAGVVEKVAEEARELAEAPPEDHKARQEELGDLLFAAVNLSRRLGIDAEEALRGANAKFRARFAAMEGAARGAGKGLEEYDASGLDALWEGAKAAERAG